MAILCLEEDRHGNGRHLWDITGDQYTAYAKVNIPLGIFSDSRVFDIKINFRHCSAFLYSYP